MGVDAVVRLAGLGTAALLGANLILVGAEAERVAPAVVPLCERPFARGEWGTDVLVEVSLSPPPAQGQQATLIVEACAKRAGRLHLDIVLPASFAWVAPPADFTPQDRISRNPANFGCLHAAYGTLVSASFEPLRLIATVAARAPGRFTVTATAKPEVGVSDASHAFLTVGRTSRSSYVGFRDDRRSRSTTTAGPPPAPSC